MILFLLTRRGLFTKIKVCIGSWKQRNVSQIQFRVCCSPFLIPASNSYSFRHTRELLHSELHRKPLSHSLSCIEWTREDEYIGSFGKGPLGAGICVCWFVFLCAQENKMCGHTPRQYGMRSMEFVDKAVCWPTSWKSKIWYYIPLIMFDMLLINIFINIQTLCIIIFTITWSFTVTNENK